MALLIVEQIASGLGLRRLVHCAPLKFTTTLGRGGTAATVANVVVGLFSAFPLGA